MPGKGFAGNLGKRNPYIGLSQAELDKLTADNLDKVSRRVIRHLKNRDLSGANVSALGVLLGISIDKARLLRGQHTSALAIAGRLDAIVKVQGLADRLTGALGSTAPIPALDNVSYSPPALPEAVECEAVECLEAAPAPAPAPRKRGRPRKVQPTATPPPSDQP